MEMEPTAAQRDRSGFSVRIRSTSGQIELSDCCCGGAEASGLGVWGETWWPPERRGPGGGATINLAAVATC